MFSPRSIRRRPSRPQGLIAPVSLVTANHIVTEYQSLRAVEALPRGVYVVPSSESLERWDGVLFIHDGPYRGSILKFSIIFNHDFPITAPKIEFTADVYHPMVDPKTKVWFPRGELPLWQAKKHHVIHILRALVLDFEEHALESITEEQAINKQLFLLYKNSHQTFLSMTAQRARHSASHQVLFGTTSEPSPTNIVPPSPTRSTSYQSQNPPSTPSKRVRQTSGLSATSAGSPGAGASEVRDVGSFRFSDISETEAEMMRREWARKLGIRPVNRPVSESQGMSDEDFLSFVHIHLGPSDDSLGEIGRSSPTTPTHPEPERMQNIAT